MLLISDFHRSLALLDHTQPYDMVALRKEYEMIMWPGFNPHKYDTPEQEEWRKRVREREQFLTMKYGGEVTDKVTYYSPLTFAHWLIREKGFKSIPFEDYCMSEFD